MANPNGKKGASFERSIADYLAQVWPWHAEWIDRRVKTGGKDKGDIANVRIADDRVVVECKNSVEHRMQLSGWVKETLKEVANDGASAGIIVHKRVGKGQPEDQYATMRLQDLVTVLKAAREDGRRQHEATG